MCHGVFKLNNTTNTPVIITKYNNNKYYHNNLNAQINNYSLQLTFLSTILNDLKNLRMKVSESFSGVLIAISRRLSASSLQVQSTP